MSEPTHNDEPSPRRTRFVGRSEELSTLGDHLEDHPLVTIVGPGGSGKTRLARELARRTGRFETVFWCDLVEASSEEALVAEVGRAVNLDLDAPAEPRQVGRHVASLGSPLIVLDNLEQIAESAATVLDVWLDAAPDATFLVTSRHPLRIRREYQFRLAPLARESAVELFIERARRVSDSLEIDASTRELIEDVAEQLDDLPLAIELAASRANLLSPRQLAERLADGLELLESRERDRASRHQTMRSTIAWTWDLLSQPERMTLAQASVFAGGFTLEAAEAVLDVPQSDWVGESLQNLVEKSLVQRRSAGDGEVRFDLYQLIREFASDQLDEKRRLDLEERHARFYADLILDIHVPKFGRDVDNVVTGFWNVVDRHADLAARAALAAYKLLRNRGAYRTIYEIVDRALSVDPQLPEVSAKLYGVRARCDLARGHYSEALESVHAGHSRVEDLQAPSSRVFLHSLEGRLQMARNDPEEARTSLREALEYAPETEDAWLVCNIEGRLAHNEFLRGHFEAAIDGMREVLEKCRRHDYTDMSAYCLEKWARYEIALGDAERASELVERAHEIHPGGELSFERSNAAARAYVALARDDEETARRLFEEALGGTELVGGDRDRIPALYGASLLQSETHGPGPEGYLRDVLRIVDGTEDTYNLAQARTRLGVVFLRRSRSEAALRELERASAALDEHPDPAIRGHVESWLAVAAAGCGERERAESHLEAARATLERADVAASMVDDVDNHFGTAVELVLSDEAPPHSELEQQLEALEEATEDRRTRPHARLWRWRQWNHLEQLKNVIDAVVEQRRGDAHGGTLRVASDGARFIPPQGEPIDLSSRQALRRILSHLAELRQIDPGAGLSVSEALEVGWPDDVVTAQAGRQRVYTAIRHLRSMGLDDLLLTGPDGYYLDPDIPLRDLPS